MSFETDRQTVCDEGRHCHLRQKVYSFRYCLGTLKYLSRRGSLEGQRMIGALQAGLLQVTASFSDVSSTHYCILRQTTQPAPGATTDLTTGAIRHELG